MFPIGGHRHVDWNSDLDDSGFEDADVGRDAETFDDAEVAENAEPDGDAELDDDADESTVRCGDGLCQEGETNETCPQDCPLSCGNGECDNERAASCPRDCPAVCGDGSSGCGGGADCDDYDENQYPGAIGPCDGYNDWDCDGFADDYDEDGFLEVDAICEGGELGDLPRTDCDDERADVNPDMDELCGDVDENCDGQQDECPALCLLANASGTCVEGECQLDECEEGYESCDRSAVHEQSTQP